MPKQTRKRPRAAPAGKPRPSREEIRRQQEEAEREARRRRRWRALVIAGVVAVVAVAAMAALVYAKRLTPEERRLLADAPAAATAAGCGDAATVPAYEGLDREHVGTERTPRMPPLSSYPSVPPVSGPHDVRTLPAGVYADPPSVGRAVHSLEHAAVVVWLSPGTEGDEERRRLEAFFERDDQRNQVIVATYDYPDEEGAEELPDDAAMALTAWHHVRYCDRPSLEVAYDFVHRYRFNLWRRGAYEGDAPERWFTGI